MFPQTCWLLPWFFPEDSGDDMGSWNGEQGHKDFSKKPGSLPHLSVPSLADSELQAHGHCAQICGHRVSLGTPCKEKCVLIKGSLNE